MRSDGRPLFGGWRWARLPKAETISGGKTELADDPYSAPEVQALGLAAADVRSDVYSLCKVLLGLFAGKSTEAAEARAVLEQGLSDDPSLRLLASEIAEDLAVIAEVVTPAKPPKSPQHWDEGSVVEWNGERFRVISRLGEGAAGRTFKLEQLDELIDEPIGTFVGKVILNPEFGEPALKAYRKIRAIADHPALSGIYQTATTWQKEYG